MSSPPFCPDGLVALTTPTLWFWELHTLTLTSFRTSPAPQWNQVWDLNGKYRKQTYRSWDLNLGSIYLEWPGGSPRKRRTWGRYNLEKEQEDSWVQWLGPQPRGCMRKHTSFRLQPASRYAFLPCIFLLTLDCLRRPSFTTECPCWSEIPQLSRFSSSKEFWSRQFLAFLDNILDYAFSH